MSGKMKWPKVKLKWRERGRGLKCHKTININRAPHLIEVISVQSVLPHRTLYSIPSPPWTGHLCTPHLNGRFVVASFEAKKLRLMTTTCACQMQLCVCMSVCVWGGGRATQRCNILYACAVATSGREEEGDPKQPGKVLCFGPTLSPNNNNNGIWMHYHGTRLSNVPSRSTSLAPLSLSLSLCFHCLSHCTFILLGHKCPQRRQTTSSCDPGNCFNYSSCSLTLFDLSCCLAPAFIICTLTLFSSLMHECKKKKLSPSPKVFTTCLLMDFKWTLTHATCHAPSHPHKTDNPPPTPHTHPHDPKKGVG